MSAASDLPIQIEPEAVPASGHIVRSALGEQWLLVGLVAAIVLVGYALEAGLGLPGLMTDLRYTPTFSYFARIFWVPLPFAFIALRLGARDSDGAWLAGRPGWRLAWRRFRIEYLNGALVLAAALAGFSLAVMLVVFSAWKLAIPRLRPFDWDPRLTALDRTLHGGRLPWEWLQPILGHPWITASLDFVYYTWLLLLVIVCVWQIWSRHRELRLRFLIAFVLVWIGLGNVVAAVFASAGPCYYRLVAAGPDPYAGLLAYQAHAATLFRLATPVIQTNLWQHYIGRTGTPYTGISAFPSIHVATAMLYVPLGWSLSRRLGLAFMAYAIVIWLGSIHLGWHYAVDGYASLIGVALIWWLSGIIVRRFGPPAAAPATAPAETAAA